MCLWPRKPWRIRIARDGFEHVIRCGECPGCLEFERRRLAGRLHAKYQDGGAGTVARSTTAATTSATSAAPSEVKLYIVRIWAPIELHASIAHALHRRRGLELEPGMWRLGASSFAILSRSASSPRDVLRAMGLKFRIEPLRLSRGRRAWRSLTAGLIVAREIYGEQRNRFYAKGLPKAEREKWEVRKIGKYQSYDRASSPRAFTGRKVVLVPPEVWKLRRSDRRALRGMLLRAPDPEGVKRVLGLVAEAADRMSAASHASGAPKALLSREQVVSWYKRNAERATPRTTVSEFRNAGDVQSGGEAAIERSRPRTFDPDLTPSFGEGGYRSSEHSQGELMPEQLDAIAIREAKRRRERKALWESLQIIERMRQKSTGGR
jgi:hypothetical protein